ncbi:IPT/TIG domain-containing protein [Reichenbachiella agarivorans]|uniref:IPT/TIG domain-containing protein n=1 Tax=Reichenbachiella agarivorans TaxID=2979464 RepID=A0ABY6CNK6_9BACT|nr:IPT/TIG domain-containing protein [Reichenbachiella agarivorans]UXP31954.1 IPT/TIG domain-containing protein [Reichenbachiella agarivorans]
MRNYTGKITGLMLAMLVAMVTLMSSCKDDEGGEEPGEGSELTITAIDPATARIGEQVTIIGTGFNPDYSQNEVKFYAGETFVDGVAVKKYVNATLVSGTSTTIVVIVPATAQDGHIIVIANGEELESSMDFVVNVSLDNPVLTSLSPTNGFPGSEVVITGENFGEGIEAIEVKFGETVATVSGVTATTITTAVPEGMTEGEVQVSVSREGAAADKTLSYTVNKIPVDVKTVYWPTIDGIHKGVINETGATITNIYPTVDHTEAGSAFGIAVDAVGGYVYWSGNGIYRASIDGNGTIETVLASDNYVFYDVALDPENQMLYFCAYSLDFGTAYINKVPMDGSVEEETIYEVSTDDEFGVESIKLSISEDKIYWTDGSYFRVMTGSIDGSTDAVVLFDEVDGLYYPTGIAVDSDNEKIYISNNGVDFVGTSEILVGNLDGSGDLEAIVSSGDYVKAPYDMEIDLENGYIFWMNSQVPANTSNSEVMRSTLDGETVEVLFGGFENGSLFDIEIGEVLPE